MHSSSTWVSIALATFACKCTPLTVGIFSLYHFNFRAATLGFPSVLLPLPKFGPTVTGPCTDPLHIATEVKYLNIIVYQRTGVSNFLAKGMMSFYLCPLSLKNDLNNVVGIDNIRDQWHKGWTINHCGGGGGGCPAKSGKKRKWSWPKKNASDSSLRGNLPNTPLHND